MLAHAGLPSKLCPDRLTLKLTSQTHILILWIENIHKLCDFMEDLKECASKS